MLGADGHSKKEVHCGCPVSSLSQAHGKHCDGKAGWSEVRSPWRRASHSASEWYKRFSQVPVFQKDNWANYLLPSHSLETLAYATCYLISLCVAVTVAECVEDWGQLPLPVANVDCSNLPLRPSLLFQEVGSALCWPPIKSTSPLSFEHAPMEPRKQASPSSFHLIFFQNLLYRSLSLSLNQSMFGCLLSEGHLVW